MTYSFISYGGSEGERIAKSLLDVWSKLAARHGLPENNGTKPFFAPRSINVGDKWEEKILNAVRQCDCFIAVVTKDFIHSAFAQQEVGIAIDQNKPIFPILGEGMTPENLPGFLKGIQAIFLADMVLGVDDDTQSDKADEGLSAVDSQPVKRYNRRRRIIRPGNVVRPFRRLRKSSTS